MPVVGQGPRTSSFPCLCWNMAAAEATPPAATGEPWAARRASQAPGPACDSSGALWRGAAARQAGRRRRWDRAPSVPPTLPAGQHRPSLAWGKHPGAAGRAENDSAWWHCGSRNGAALERPASPSALCESKKPQRGLRSHPSFPSGIGSTGVLGELLCLPLASGGGPSVPKEDIPGTARPRGSFSPSLREQKSTLPGNRVPATSVHLLRDTAGDLPGPKPSSPGAPTHKHRCRWHVARGSGLACPLLLRASLPLLSRAAAASSGWTSRPQVGLGRCGGRRGGDRARSGEKPGWQTAPAHPGLGPGGGRGGVTAVGGSRAIPCAPPPPRSAPEWLWAVGGRGGCTTGQVETPGSPSTRAGDLGEGHVFSGPFRIGLPGSVSVFHPSPPSAPCPVQPKPSCIPPTPARMQKYTHDLCRRAGACLRAPR